MKLKSRQTDIYFLEHSTGVDRMLISREMLQTIKDAGGKQIRFGKETYVWDPKCKQAFRVLHTHRDGVHLVPCHAYDTPSHGMATASARKKEILEALKKGTPSQ